MNKAISLYTGAGGLDLGLEKARIQTSVAVEMDSDSIVTLKRNRDWEVCEGDIHNVTSQSILERGGFRVGDADLLVGGPPCQPFSKSAYWARGDTKRLDDPRASTLEQYLRVLRDTQPRAFLLENVPGLGYAGKDEGLQLLLRWIEAINNELGTCYDPSFKILNAVEFGVPQDRRRLFIVAARDGTRFEFPEETHQVSDEQLDLGGSSKDPALTSWDAIGDLENHDEPGLEVTGKWADLLPTIPEGSNYLYHTDRGGGQPIFGWRRRYWSFLLKLSKRKPSWTLTAQPGSAIGPFHWNSRRLSAHEMARLQTFPEPYSFYGGRTSVQRQIGNAVPSLLGEVLGREIRRQLLKERSLSNTLQLLPVRRHPVPEPEPTRPVPEKYLKLVGDHPPHPGTGKGPGAIERNA